MSARCVLAFAVFARLVFGLPSYSVAASGDLDPSFGQNGAVRTRFEASLHNQATDLHIQQGDALLVGSNAAVLRYRANGDLDPEFASAGIASLPILVYAIALQPADPPQADRIVAVGRFFSDTSDFAAVRLLPDGSLDTSFGRDGIATIDFSQRDDIAIATAVQSDRRILLTGYSYGSIPESVTVARLEENGELDLSFGDGTGRASEFIEGAIFTTGVGVAQLPSGRIVVAGDALYTSDWVFTLIGLTEDGALDPGFGEGGVTITGLTGSTANGMTITGDGKIILFGAAGSNFAIARYDHDGILDAGFDDDGIVVMDVSREDAADYAGGVLAFDDGSILVCGTVRTNDWPANEDIVLARYLDDGRLDTSFGQKGILRLDDSGLSRRATTIGLQSDHKLLIAGAQDNAVTGRDVFLTRLTAEGVADVGFGVAGTTTTDFAGPVRSSFHTSLIRHSGKILSCGKAGYSDELNDFACAQHLPDGKLDADFADKGTLTLDAGGTRDSVAEIAEDDQGRVVAFGTSSGEAAGSARMTAFRLLENGDLDLDFGEEGFVRAESGTVGRALSLQKDGRILVAGDHQWSVQNTPTPPDEVLVIRYLSDGKPDLDFGTDGIAVLDWDGPYDAVSDMLVQNDGRIVLAGAVHHSDQSGNDIAVTRLTELGETDPSFGEDGTAYFDSGVYDAAAAIAEGPDSGILLSGNANKDLMLLRLLESGEPDLEFGENGRIVMDASSGGWDDLRSLVVQNDGKILTAGCSGNEFCSEGVTVTRHEKDGAIDESFGDGGTIHEDASKAGLDPVDIDLQENGAIVVTGGPAYYADALLLRYQGDETTVHCGDADFSSSVDTFDALVTLRTAVGTSNCLACICDADGSGSTTAADALHVLRVAVGNSLPLECPIRCGSFSGASRQ